MRYVKKEYEVLEGEADNRWYVPPVVVHAHIHRDVLPDDPIVLPHTFGKKLTTEESRTRYQMVKDAHKVGLVFGTKVMRRCHLSPAFFINPRMHGVIIRFVFSIQPGYNDYRPILVSFKTSNNTSQEFPFFTEELISITEAKKHLQKVYPELVIHDPIDSQANSRIALPNAYMPHREKSNAICLPHRNLDE